MGKHHKPDPTLGSWQEMMFLAAISVGLPFTVASAAGLFGIIVIYLGGE